MNKSIMLSLNPKWFESIMSGQKTREVRKRAPLQRHPYKVYLYCTKNGNDIYRCGVKGKFKPFLYEKPKNLADFGIKRAPQSWCYLKGESK